MEDKLKRIKTKIDELRSSYFSLLSKSWYDGKPPSKEKLRVIANKSAYITKVLKKCSKL